jgi:hypothetical protein
MAIDLARFAERVERVSEARVRTAEVYLDTVRKVVGGRPIPGVDDVADAAGRISAAVGANADFDAEREATRNAFLTKAKEYFGGTVRGWFSGLMKTARWLGGDGAGEDADRARLDGAIANLQAMADLGIAWWPIYPTDYLVRMSPKALEGQTAEKLQWLRDMPDATRAGVAEFWRCWAAVQADPAARQFCRTAIFTIVDNSAVSEHYGAHVPTPELPAEGVCLWPYVCGMIVGWARQRNARALAVATMDRASAWWKPGGNGMSDPRLYGGTAGVNWMYDDFRSAAETMRIAVEFAPTVAKAYELKPSWMVEHRKQSRPLGPVVGLLGSIGLVAFGAPLALASLPLAASLILPFLGGGGARSGGVVTSGCGCKRRHGARR